MTIWKRQNYGDNKKISGCQSWQREMNKQSTEDCEGSKNTLYDIVMMDLCHTFFQTHRMYNTKIR